jgi:hypothetical protein
MGWPSYKYRKWTISSPHVTKTLWRSARNFAKLITSATYRTWHAKFDQHPFSGLVSPWRWNCQKQAVFWDSQASAQPTPRARPLALYSDCTVSCKKLSAFGGFVNMSRKFGSNLKTLTFEERIQGLTAQKRNSAFTFIMLNENSRNRCV